MREVTRWAVYPNGVIYRVSISASYLRIHGNDDYWGDEINGCQAVSNWLDFIPTFWFRWQAAWFIGDRRYIEFRKSYGATDLARGKSGKIAVISYDRPIPRIGRAVDDPALAEAELRDDEPWIKRHYNI